MRGRVLDVSHVLQPALDLERADAGIGQRAQVGALVVVLHRQQVLVEGHDAALLVFQLVGQAAGLRAFAAIGAASGVGVADVALPGKGHAERAVDEEFEDGRRIAWHADFLPVCAVISVSDSSRASTICEKPTSARKLRLLRRADVGLGRGVQFDGRQVGFQQAHVLQDQGVGPGLVHLPGQAARFLDFVVAENRVEGDEDLRVEAVGEGRQALDVLHRIAGADPGAEGRPADIHRIGAVPDRLDADVGILGGGEEFEGGGGCGHGRAAWRGGGGEL